MSITGRTAAICLVLMIFSIFAGVMGWRFFWGGDERAIEKVFKQAIELANKKGAEGQLTAIGRAAQLAGLFSTPLRVQPLPSVSSVVIDSQEDLRAAVFRARSSVDSITVQVLDHQVEVGPEGTGAVMYMAVKGAFDGDPALNDEIYRFRVQWKKVDGDWKIEDVRSEDTIRRPPGA